MSCAFFVMITTRACFNHNYSRSHVSSEHCEYYLHECDSYLDHAEHGHADKNAELPADVGEYA